MKMISMSSQKRGIRSIAGSTFPRSLRAGTITLAEYYPGWSNAWSGKRNSVGAQMAQQRERAEKPIDDPSKTEKRDRDEHPLL